MALWLKQSTSVTVQFGPFLDKTDGVTLETGLATAMDNATTGIRLSKNGATLVDRNDATVPAYDAMGLYKIVLDATDTGTLGTLRMVFEEAATCLPVWQDFMVVPANVWDSFFGADNLDVNTTQWAGSATATNDVALATAPTNFADLSITATSGRVDVGSWLGTAVTVSSTTAKPEVDVNSISDDATAANNAELMFDGTGYAGGTTKLDVNIASTNDIDLSATQKASVNTEVDNAIVTYGLDHLVSAAVIGTDVADNSIAAKLVSSSATADWDDFVNTTDSLQATRDHIGDGTNLTEAGGTGDHLTALATAAALTTAQTDLDTITGSDGVTLATTQANYAPATAAAATAIEADTQDIQSRIPTALVGGRIDATIDATGMEPGAVSNILTTQMTEAYAADGTAPTLAQALFLIQQMLGEFAISTTTKTVKKLDGSTSAATFTLDDETSPTSITRAT